jgi:hypothetical protein
MVNVGGGVGGIAGIGGSIGGMQWSSANIKDSLSSPVLWTSIIFLVDVAIIAALYFGFGGFKGDVAS